MDCNVILDLMPLCIDGCCSEESSRLVEEHLADCENCRRVRAQMAASVQPGPDAAPPAVLRRVSDWKASLLQSAVLFVSFAVITAGVALESATPAGAANGQWAVALIVPATGYLLSMANWFFLRIYRSRRMFSLCSCGATLAMILLGYGWAAVHYSTIVSPLTWLGVAVSAVLCVLSKVLSNRYALLLGRE